MNSAHVANYHFGRQHYNQVRPYSSLGNQTPATFKKQFVPPNPKPFSRNEWPEEIRQVTAILQGFEFIKTDHQAEAPIANFVHPRDKSRLYFARTYNVRAQRLKEFKEYYRLSLHEKSLINWCIKLCIRQRDRPSCIPHRCDTFF